LLIGSSLVEWKTFVGGRSAISRRGGIMPLTRGGGGGTVRIGGAETDWVSAAWGVGGAWNAWYLTAKRLKIRWLLWWQVYLRSVGWQVWARSDTPPAGPHVITTAVGGGAVPEVVKELIDLNNEHVNFLPSRSPGMNPSLSIGTKRKI
jgi:hypothetical protein